MGTLDAYEQEIHYQVHDLPMVMEGMDGAWLSSDEQSRALITGSGDSFAAAMIAERLSGFRIQCIDPLELASIMGSLAGRRMMLYIVSISGSTKAALDAMEMAHRHGMKVVAITANAESRLARGADSSMLLRFRRSGMLTAGSIGFTASLLASASLAIRMGRVSVDIDGIFSQAKSDSRDMVLDGHIYIVGDVLTYPLAVYGAAKVYEVLGARASYCRLEQFCHMEVFSLADGDKVLVLSSEEKARRLVDGLRGSGIDAKLIEYAGREGVSSSNDGNAETLARLLYHTFLLQFATLNSARRLGLKECAFIGHRLLGLSSALIY
ncbi:MAG: SIS domain-containing protein [Candidatus Nitrosocaldus sp.]|nr:SIS domain-containing protein [Candidatus Nitrosocaldus sp.]MDW7999680.1 SIS domain-containing protein [Candidatus Nitrosocaldus sp.]